MDTNKLDVLIKTANHCLTDAVEDTNIFLDKVTSYLEDLDSWKLNVTAEEVSCSSQEVKTKIKNLLEIHQQVLDKSNLLKTEVSKEISELSKKTNMLKAYLNHSPGRVTIAGTRKG